MIDGLAGQQVPPTPQGAVGGAGVAERWIGAGGPGVPNLARLQNIGWDDSAEKVEQVAREVLTKAGVAEA
eukprot:12430886-Karenia_brevis.AAC.1